MSINPRTGLIQGHSIVYVFGWLMFNMLLKKITKFYLYLQIIKYECYFLEIYSQRTKHRNFQFVFTN